MFEFHCITLTPLKIYMKCVNCVTVVHIRRKNSGFHHKRWTRRDTCSFSMKPAVWFNSKGLTARCINSNVNETMCLQKWPQICIYTSKPAHSILGFLIFNKTTISSCVIKSQQVIVVSAKLDIVSENDTLLINNSEKSHLHNLLTNLY